MSEFSPEVQAFLSLVVQGVIPVLSSFLVGIIGVVLFQANAWLKANAAQSQLKQMKSIVDFLVMAAEQSGLTGKLQEEGSAKKSWVVGQVRDQLNTLGLTKLADDVTLISNLIESSVYELNNITLPPLIDAAELIAVQPAPPNDDFSRPSFG